MANEIFFLLLVIVDVPMPDCDTVFDDVIANNQTVTTVFVNLLKGPLIVIVIAERTAFRHGRFAC